MPFPARRRRAPRPALAAGVILLLAGCSFADETILPALSGENPRAVAAAREATAARTGRPVAASGQAQASGEGEGAAADVLQDDLARVRRQLDGRREELGAVRGR